MIYREIVFFVVCKSANSAHNSDCFFFYRFHRLRIRRAYVYRNAFASAFVEILKQKFYRDVRLIVRIKIAHNPTALFVENADDFHFFPADSNNRADCVIRALRKKLFGEFVAEHNGIASAFRFQLVEKSSCGKSEISRLQIFGSCCSYESIFNTRAVVFQRSARKNARRNCDRKFSQFFVFLVFVVSQIFSVAQFPPRFFVIEPSPFVDVKIIAAERRNALLERQINSFKRGGHRNDSPNSDYDSERR